MNPVTTLCAAFTLLFGVDVASASLHDSIYYTFDDANTDGVSMLLNVNGPIGATSNSMAGDVGALFKIEKESDVDTFKSAQGDAYVALISQPMVAKASVMKELLNQGKVKGFLIYDVDDLAPWSSDSDELAWNPLGGGYGDNEKLGLHWKFLGRPAFLLKEDDKAMIMEKYNQSESIMNPNGRTLGVRLSFFMWAATNAETCLRRSAVNGGYFCQPLGGQNVGGPIRPYSNATDASDKASILVTSQIDALSLFHDNSYGASDTGASLAAFIALARAVTSGTTAEDRKNAAFNVLFMGLQGEQFDHIGASVLYESLLHNIDGMHFPSKKNQISMDDIKYHIELGQMMSSSDSENYFVYKNGSTDIYADLTSNYGFVEPSNNERGFPSTSSMRALRNWNSSWANEGVVVANFDGQYGNESTGNQHLYTRHDDAANIHIANVSSTKADRIVNMCKAVVSLAKYVRSKAALPQMSDETAVAEDCQQVSAQLLHMLLVNGAAPVLIADYNISIAAQENVPVNRYVSVADVATVTQIEAVIFWHLSAALNDPQHNASECTDSLVECSDSHFDAGMDKTAWCKVQPSGAGVTASILGIPDTVPCWTSTTFFQNALSPGFNSKSNAGIMSYSINGDFSSKYSTWTESTWQVGKVEVFLLQDQAEANAMLAGGIVYALVVTLVVWQSTKRCGLPNKE